MIKYLNIKKLVLIYFCLSLLISTNCYANTSIKPAGSGIDDSTIGSVIWSTPTNIYLDDANYAIASVARPSSTHYLKATNFGFNIPFDAKIIGISVTFNLHYTTGSPVGNMVDNSIKIVKNNVIGGNEKSAGATWPITTDANTKFGSSSDLWGLSWTAADINAADFGVVLSGSNTGAPSSISTASVDYVEIMVTYIPKTKNKVNFEEY